MAAKPARHAGSQAMVSAAPTPRLLRRNGMPVFGRAGCVGQAVLVGPLRQLNLRQSNHLVLLSASPLIGSLRPVDSNGADDRLDGKMLTWSA
jgi:hypothetical protein